ncbi:hypothetical protein FPV67DRAFT_1509269 [Lyophyllum atratum]|nr:hypothetical protein FPV67DRAFT_1509269 [Lyophyllum atratum]
MSSLEKTSIALAIEAIQAASRKVKLTTEVEDSLGQLNSIVKLLEISKLWPTAFHRLTSLLRQRLLPLYKIFPILGIRYAIALLTTIHETKIIPAAKSNDKVIKDSWEVVQAALLSGILDFLEANSSSENRAIVATALYPTLRLNLLPRPSVLPGPDLMYILYQLLSETVTSHPVNQAQLRDQEIFGGIQIGTILSQTKNFLVIEALLELFVKILPPKSSKDGIKTRAHFIQDVFDPAKFACSAAIIEVFESPPNTDWEDIFFKLIDLLASTDPEFPQPFKTTNFRIPESKAYRVERIYVDHQGFVANIDEGDQIETFHAKYTTVQDVKVSALSEVKSRVTIQLLSPPSIGQATINHASDEKTSTVFDIDEKEVTRFLRSLKTRGVTSVNQTGRKLSTAETSLELDYVSTRKIVPLSTQEKVRDLARLWDFSNSQSHSGQVLPTSPLVPRRSPSVQLLSGSVLAQPTLPIPDNSKTPTKAATPDVSSPYYDSIFGTPDEELSELSGPDDTEIKPSRRSARLSGAKKLRSTAKVTLESDSEPATVRRIKTKNKKIVLSDDDDMDNLKSPSIKSLQPPRPNGDHAPSESSAPNDPADTRAVQINAISNSAADARTTETNKILLEKPVNTAAHNAADLDAVPVSNSLHPITTTITNSVPPQILVPTSVKGITKPAASKRKAVKDANPDIERSPPKRRRKSPEAKSERPPPRKRYGKRGRTSSPAPSSILDLNFDELPVPSTDAVSDLSEGKQSNRVSAMKDKNGKAALKKAKPDARQPSEMKDVIVLDASPVMPQKKGHVKPKAETKKEPLLSKPTVKNKKIPLDAASEPQRRSARVAGISPVIAQESPQLDKIQGAAMKALPPQPKPEVQPDYNTTQLKKVAPQKKPRDVPWHDLDLKKLAALQTSGTIVTGELLAREPPPIERVDDEPSFPIASSPSTDPVAEEVVEEWIIEDYVMPLKTGSESISFEMEAAKDEVMIDLTRDPPVPSPQPVITHSISKSKSHAIRPTIKDVPDFSGQDAIKAQTPRRSPVWSPPLSNPDHPRVSFAPSASIRPYFNLPSPQPAKHDTRSSYSHKYPFSKHREKQTFDDKREYDGYPERRRDKDPMPRIIDVITEITQVVVQNTSHRFDKVSKDLRAGQRSIRLETAYDLEAILDESIRHHQKFVSLESEYATHHRKIIDRLEDASKVGEELSGLLAGTIQEHNRNSLSRKFSNTLFSLPLPPIISDPRLML